MKYRDSIKIRLVEDKEPFNVIGTAFYPAVPRVGEEIYYVKNYLVRAVRHFGNRVNVWVEATDERAARLKKEREEQEAKNRGRFPEFYEYLDSLDKEEVNDG